MFELISMFFPFIVGIYLKFEMFGYIILFSMLINSSQLIDDSSYMFSLFQVVFSIVLLLLPYQF